ncbi:MAG: ParB/RepB/Spo0J family partition protein [Acidobacteria bacterium]|nr:ParB/RepB/Spo0J family partition protein [Acidobacteriota bacterium]MCA1611200.1 ParB/RepB/Spo0J family partition protein [Acidobacteriota bacterium]
MKGKQALGRGLSALLPGGRDEHVPRGTVRDVEIDSLEPGRFQPRRDFHPESLAELAASIREQGIVQPIVVVANGGKFEIVAGERRWRAARQAGLGRVPVVVREAGTDRDLLEIALVENLQREDLNPLEAASAYLRLKEEFHLTQEDVARRVGKDRATVANSLRLLRLPAAVRERVRTGEISAGHARALLALATPDDQEAVAAEIVRRALSVRQTEKRIAALAVGGKVRKEQRRDPFTRDAEEKLSRRLGTRVRIVRRRRGGRIEMAFASEEELIGLFERLSGKD